MTVKIKTYPKLASKLIDIQPDFPGFTREEKVEKINIVLRKVATAKQDNVDPNDPVLLHLHEQIRTVWKKRHVKQEDANRLFSIFMTLFSGRISSFATHLSRHMPKEGGFVKLTDEHDLRMAGFNIDLKEGQVGRFPVINATLNWGRFQYKGTLVWTPSIQQDIGEMKDAGVVGYAGLIIWSNQPHNYRYLEKRGLKKIFTVVSIKRTSSLH